MVKIRLLTTYLGSKAGDILEVDRNIAHGLIENKVAAAVSAKIYNDRMLKSTDMETK